MDKKLKKHIATKAEQILEHLQLKGIEGATTAQLKQVDHRFSSGIHILRQKGYLIEKTPLGKNRVDNLYVLKGRSSTTEKPTAQVALYRELKNAGINEKEVEKIVKSLNLSIQYKPSSTSL